MMFKQLIQPIGGMNRDDDPRYLPEGDYLDLLNARGGSNQDQSTRGLIESFISHYTIDMSVTDANTFTELSVAEDVEHDEAFILAHQGGATPYFQIFRFNVLTDAIVKIYQAEASLWGITADTKIYNPKILDRKLVFTDNVGPVRYIDVDRLEKSYIQGTGTGMDVYETIIEPEIFSLAVSRPVKAAVPTYITNLNRLVNNLSKQTFQVSYRYVYIDFRKSPYASPSIVPSPNKEEEISGEEIIDRTHNNGLKIQIPSGPGEVKLIEVIGRSSEDPAGWFIMGEINRFNDQGTRIINSNIIHDFYWYNDAVKRIIDIEEVYTLFTYVPVKARHLEVIEGNRIVVANITEGYDGVQSDVSIELEHEDITGNFTPSVKGDSTLSQLNFTFKGASPADPELVFAFGALDTLYIVTYTLGGRALTENERDVFLMMITGSSNYANKKWATVAGDPSGTQMYNLIDTYFNIPLYDNYLNSSTSGEAIIIAKQEGSEFDIAVLYTNATYVDSSTIIDFSEGDTPASGDLIKYPTLKKGTTQQWGIIYRDAAGWVSPIVGTAQMEKYIPFPPEMIPEAYTTTPAPGQYLFTRPKIEFKINHLPPAWATSYEIVYRGNRTVAWFLQLMAYDIKYGKKDHEDPIDEGNRDIRFLRIDIDKMYALTRSGTPNWSVEQYIWEEGDRIRIIGLINNAGGVQEHDQLYDIRVHGTYIDIDYVDGETTSESTFVYFQYGEGFPDFTLGDDIFVEIYRPYKDFETIFYFTTGMVFEIGTDVGGHKYHKGDTDQVLTDGAPSTPAIIANNSHDAWIYIRNFANKDGHVNHSIPSESMYASDYYYVQRLTSTGIPIPYLENYGQKVLPKRLRHGGRLNFGTELNNIAKFDYNDFEDMKDEHGPIESIRETGFILKVIQYNKVSSIFISRIESYSPTGDPQYLFTDKVFGSMRPELHKWGTKHPESVVVHGNNMYFWDQTEGVVIRDALNGALPISEYKMFRYFKDKAKELDTYNTPEVVFMFSIEDRTLMCTFSDGTNYETIAFIEGDNRWKFRTDAKIKKPFWIGRRLYHFHQGKIYQWWRDTEETPGTTAPPGTYLELSGEQKTWQLVVVANEHPMKVKHFNSLAVYQEGDTPDAEIVVPQKISATGRKMESIVGSQTWKQREGIWYGPILRDINTPNMTGDNNKYLNGLRLRGQYCEITLKGNKTDGPVRLFNVMVMATPSERSM